MRWRGMAALVLVVAGLVAPAGARAADPGRWTLSSTTSLPLVYYQGVTVEAAHNLFFDGIFVGLYRTTPAFAETGRNDDVIPPDVQLREGYNHIGDIAWDAREGGRVLLPLECYYPGQANNGNTCLNGAIGVADPATLQWRGPAQRGPAAPPQAPWDGGPPPPPAPWASARGAPPAHPPPAAWRA